MTQPVPFEASVTETAGPPMELADAVEAIRAQLIEAMSRGQGKGLQFALGDLELEFAVSLTQDRQARGGIKVWVVNADGSVGTSAARTQRVKVTLKPIDPQSGEPAKISDAIDPRRSR